MKIVAKMTRLLYRAEITILNHTSRISFGEMPRYITKAWKGIVIYCKLEIEMHRLEINKWCSLVVEP